MMGRSFKSHKLILTICSKNHILQCSPVLTPQIDGLKAPEEVCNLENDMNCIRNQLRLLIIKSKTFKLTVTTMESGQSSVVPELSAAVGPRRSKISKSNLRSQTPSNIQKIQFLESVRVGFKH